MVFLYVFFFFFFFQAEDGIRDLTVTGVQTCALPIYHLASAGLVVGCVVLGGGVTVSQASAAWSRSSGMPGFSRSFLKSMRAGMDWSFCGSVPRRTTRMGALAGLASAAAVRVRVTSPDSLAGTSALVAVTPGGRPVTTATSGSAWPWRRVYLNFTGALLPAARVKVSASSVVMT